MTNERDRARGTESTHADVDHATAAPGKTSRSELVQRARAPVPSGILRRARDRDEHGVAPDAGDAVATASATGGGAPLPSQLLRKFEASLGADLSSVRVHTDDASAGAASAVSAKAYTLGQNIHFGAGHYDPSSSTGEHLLAHEVAHTVQQAGGVRYKLEVSSPGDAFEIEADRAADAMVSGAQASVTFASGIALHRNKKPEPVVTVGEVTQVNKNSNAVAVAELTQLRDRVTATIARLTQTQIQCKAYLASAMKNYKVVQDVHRRVWAKYLAEVKAANAEEQKHWLDEQTAEHHKTRVEELVVKGVIAGCEAAAEHYIGPVATGLAFVLEVAISGALEKAPAPPPPVIVPKTSKFDQQDLDALFATIAKSFDVIDCGITSGQLSAKNDALSQHIEQLMTSKADVAPNGLSCVEQGLTACAKADTATSGVTSACAELVRQSWIQGALANEDKLLENFKTRAPDEQKKVDIAVDAIGSVAQIMTTMNPTGTASVPGGTLDAKLMQVPSNASAAKPAVSGTFRKVVGNDGPVLILDYQDTADAKGVSDSTTEKGVHELIGTFVTALENMTPAGAVQDIQGHKQAARASHHDDAIPCGAHVKVDAIDGTVLVVEAGTSQAKGKYAAYGGGVADDLFFPSAKADPQLVPEKYGYTEFFAKPLGLVYIKHDYKLVRPKDEPTSEFWVEPLSTPRDEGDYEQYYPGKQ